MYGYIYLWINLITNGKYVGKHKYPKLEWDPNYTASGELIQKKIEEYGIENFKRVMLDACDTLEELNSAEKYWIYELETYAGWNKGGYNLTLGGDGFTGKHSEESKRKIGDFWRGQHREGHPAWNKNIPHTDRTKEIIREKRKNQKIRRKSVGKTILYG